MLLRASGRIVRLDAREGISNGTGRPWRIPSAHLLIEDQGVAEVNLSDVKESQVKVGDNVDWLVNVETQGRYLSVRFVSDIAPLNLPKPSPVPAAKVG